jgi:hypothetical protein
VVSRAISQADLVLTPMRATTLPSGAVQQGVLIEEWPYDSGRLMSYPPACVWTRLTHLVPRRRGYDSLAVAG